MSVLLRQISECPSVLRKKLEPIKGIAKSIIFLIIAITAVFFRQYHLIALSIIGCASICNAILTEPREKFLRIYGIFAATTTLTLAGIIGGLELAQKYQIIFF